MHDRLFFSDCSLGVQKGSKKKRQRKTDFLEISFKILEVLRLFTPRLKKQIVLGFFFLHFTMVKREMISRKDNGKGTDRKKPRFFLGRNTFFFIYLET